MADRNLDQKNRSKVKVLVFVEAGRPSTGCDVFSCKSSKGKFVNQFTPDDDKFQEFNIHVIIFRSFAFFFKKKNKTKRLKLNQWTF